MEIQATNWHKIISIKNLSQLGFDHCGVVLNKLHITQFEVQSFLFGCCDNKKFLVKSSHSISRTRSYCSFIEVTFFIKKKKKRKKTFNLNRSIRMQIRVYNQYLVCDKSVIPFQEVTFLLAQASTCSRIDCSQHQPNQKENSKDHIQVNILMILIKK